MTKRAYSRRQFLHETSLATLLALLPLRALAAAKIPFEQWDSLMPYLRGLYAPTSQENTAPIPLTVVGKIPEGISGTYFRNGPNPRYTEFRRHHWFDGDGMIHKIRIENGAATYQNRLVATNGLRRETRAGKKIFAGLQEIFDLKIGSGKDFAGVLTMIEKAALAAENSLHQTSFSRHPLGRTLKDTANTDLIYFGGKLIPLWWLSGTPYTLDPSTLETTGVETFGGTYHGEMAAHARQDPETGDLFFLNFGQVRKFVSVSRVSKEGKLAWTEKFELPYPRIYHDLLFTKDYVVLLDFPLGFLTDPKTGSPTIGLDRTSDQGFSRIILLPRDNPKEKKVFPFHATYALHGLNAFQTDEGVTIYATKYTDPIVNRQNDDDSIPKVGLLRVETVTVRWDLTFAGMTLKETILDDVNTEFPRVNDTFLGRASRYSYHPRLVAEPQVLFDGLIKYDLHSGAKSVLSYGGGLLGEEAVFLPRPGATAEDDGWVGTFVRDRAGGACEYRIYDAKSLDREPVARILIPQGLRVPAGFHGKWVAGI